LAEEPIEGYAALVRAESLLELHRPDEAEPLLRRAIAADPAAVRPRCLLANSFLSRGLHDEALRAATEAASVDPTQEWPHRIRALALAGAGKRKEAVAAAREAVRLAPSEVYTYVVLTETLLKVKDRKGAAQAAERARALAPGSTQAFLALGAVALARRKWREAEEHYLDALRTDPENSAALNNLGVALKAQGRNQEAVHFFAESAKRDPRDPTARKNAVSAAQVGMGAFAIVSVQVGRAVFSALHGTGLAVAYAVLSVAVIATMVLAGRSWRRSRRTDLPKASKELMRSLRKEGRRAQRTNELRLLALAGATIALCLATTFLLVAAMAAISGDLVTAAVGSGVALVGGFVARLAWQKRRSTTPAARNTS
jgi:tetratricopeptide (TPR) repeat protein